MVVSLIMKNFVMFLILFLMNLILLFILIYPESVTAEEVDDHEVTWLAKNVYFEARNQGIAGQIAVAQVTLNRVGDHRFPNTIKEVVTQSLYKKSWRDGSNVPIRNKCQFSWWCDGKTDTIFDWKTFNKIKTLMLTYVSNSSIIDITEGATHYHADYVLPDWAATKTKTIEIEDHIFYRWEK